MACLADTLIASLEGSRVHAHPYRHWLLNEVMPPDVARIVDTLDIPMGEGLDYGGRRELNNSKRAFFDAERQADNQTIAQVAQAFRAPQTIATIESMTGCDLTGSFLRMEYAQDTEGFWLEPHTDIGVKLFTMLWYLSVGEGSDNCGTDIFDPQGTLVKTAPFTFNGALIFVPATDTFHGFNQRRINGIRKSVIVNYVTPEWRARHELTFQEPVK
jgi:hypothetical protein